MNWKIIDIFLIAMLKFIKHFYKFSSIRDKIKLER